MTLLPRASLPQARVKNLCPKNGGADDFLDEFSLAINSGRLRLNVGRCSSMQVGVGLDPFPRTHGALLKLSNYLTFCLNDFFCVFPFEVIG